MVACNCVISAADVTPEREYSTPILIGADEWTDEWADEGADIRPGSLFVMDVIQDTLLVRARA
jgi:hypothetical protein